MTVILCLCDCVWGSLWPLLALTCAHWGSSWSSCITRWYTIRNWGWRSWVQAGRLSNGSCFYGCCHMSVYISDEINDMQWLTWSNLLMVVFTSFASQRKVSVQELSWHLHQNKFSCFNVIEWSLWPSLHFCDILSLWLSVWGSVWPLFASVCAHRWYSWSSCHYQMIYDS